ncbi:MAG: AAA family ATPase [Candidatus Krumholzibacteriia bacterium]
MLLELRITDFALAEDVTVPLGPGLTVLTGETGAGKSMVAGALSLLAGGRAPKDLVRRGREEAVVEGVFEVDLESTLAAALARHGVLPGADGILVLRREVRREGRSRVLVNGRISSLAVLEEIGPHLVAVQSQDQQRELSDPDFARRYLDGQLGHDSLLAEVAAARREHRALAEELAERRDEERLAREQQDLWEYQHRELDGARLDPEEEAELAERLLVARHAATLQEGAAAALDALSEGEWNARERLGAVQTALAPLSRQSGRMAEIAEQVEGAADILQTASLDLQRFLEGLDTDPRGLDELEARQELYHDLRRKYGRDVSALLELRDRLTERLQKQARVQGDLRRLESDLAAARGRLQDAAVRLHEARTRGAAMAAERVESVVRALALPDLEVVFAVEPATADDGAIEVEGRPCAVAAHGADRIRLLVRTNPGEEAGEAARIASGGERSRIHLGLTALAQEPAAGRLLLLDEIDAGLGMDTAPPVARLLQRIARRNQVVCITHLPTMAVHGRRHLRVEKVVGGGRTALRLRVLAPEERVAEVARLLGGEGYADRDRDAQETYARQLLRTGGAVVET